MTKPKTFLVKGVLFIPKGDSVGHAVDYIFSMWYQSKIESVERVDGGKSITFIIRVNTMKAENVDTLVISFLDFNYILKSCHVIEINK